MKGKMSGLEYRNIAIIEERNNDDRTSCCKLKGLKTITPLKQPLLSHLEVKIMEDKLGVVFNDQYRYFLTSGSDIFYGSIEPANIVLPESHNSLPSIVQSARFIGLPEELFPFCEDNSDFYCFNKEGNVVYWSHDGATDETWKDLATWIMEVWLDENA